MCWPPGSNCAIHVSLDNFPITHHTGVIQTEHLRDLGVIEGGISENR
jgi:hypothetical protein